MWKTAQIPNVPQFIDLYGILLILTLRFYHDDKPDVVSIYRGWKRGQILTVVLDCDRGAVHYYIDEQAKQQDNIEKGKYWFAMIMCASNKTHCRVVKTPDAIVGMYD